MAGCAAQVKRLTLELGGKSANVVFADADLEKAAATAPCAVFDNAGQDCCARSRILVAALGLRPVPGAAGAGGAGCAGRGPGAGHGRDGAADQPRPVGPGRLLRPGRRAGGLPRQRARRAPGSGSRRRCSLPSTRGTGGDRGDLRPGRRRRPLRGRGRRRPARQRERVRPVRLDLDPRPRPGAAGLARHRGRQPVGQQPLVGALLDAVRRLQAVGARPRARAGRAALVHRREERLPRRRKGERGRVRQWCAGWSTGSRW